jgi:hypothetical protein
MNHSAQVLPNCSSTVAGKDGRGVFHRGHYRMSVRVYACVHACVCVHTCTYSTTLTLQKACKGCHVIRAVMKSAGNLYMFNCGFFCLLPLLISSSLFGYLAPWGSLCASAAPPGVSASKLLTCKLEPCSQLRPLTAQQKP